MSKPHILAAVLAGLRQAFRAIAGCLIVLASLLVFPNAVPWMIAAWLAGYAVLALSGGRSLLCLPA